MNRVVMYLEDDELEEIQDTIKKLHSNGRLPKFITSDTIRRLCDDYESEDIGAAPDDDGYEEDNDYRQGLR